MKRDQKTGRFLVHEVPPLERFNANYEVAPSGCWEWTGCVRRTGYGVFHPTPKQVAPHIWSYQYFKGPIPDGLTVDHQCRNRRCVNPDHLRLLTRGDNVLASPESNAGRNMRKTHCDRGHPLEGDNLIVIPNFRNPERPPWRQCRECAIMRKRARRAAAALRS